MTIHSLYIFNRSGGCLYYGEWHRPKYSLASTPDEDRKLMFGFCFEMCTTMNKMSPVMEPPPAGSPATNAAMPDSGFMRVVTDSYAIHHLETPTGYHFVLTTDTGAGDMRGILWYVYEALLVNFALKNPLYLPGTAITSAGFIAELDKFVKSLPAFKAQG